MANPFLSLPTSVEERIAGWIRIQERQAAQAKAKRPGPTITLSRQFGCEGFPLSCRLQEQLEATTQQAWTIFDRALLDQVAADEGISRRLLADLGGDSATLEAFGFHPQGSLTSDEAFIKIAMLLTKVAKVGNVIIIGRGGAILCHDLPNAFHFRLVASFDWRVASIMRRLNLSNHDAAQLVKTQGRQRAQFLQRSLGADAEDPRHYDAVFNNERHTVEETAAAICAYVHAGWKG